MQRQDRAFFLSVNGQVAWYLYRTQMSKGSPAVKMNRGGLDPSYEDFWQPRAWVQEKKRRSIDKGRGEGDSTSWVKPWVARSGVNVNQLSVSIFRARCVPTPRFGWTRCVVPLLHGGLLSHLGGQWATTEAMRRSGLKEAGQVLGQGRAARQKARHGSSKSGRAGA